MSIWADWRCGAISDEDYMYECWKENEMEKDRQLEELYGEPDDEVD